MTYTKNIKIYSYNSEEQNSNFYSIIGKYFAFREYAKEMGGWQFYNKDNSVWFLLYVDDILAGFCCMFVENTHIFYDNFYIFKEYRNKGLSKILFDYRLKECKKYNKEIRAIVENPIQDKNYIRNNFEYYGNRGHYKKWRLL